MRSNVQRYADIVDLSGEAGVTNVNRDSSGSEMLR